MKRAKFQSIPNGYVNASGKFIDAEFVTIHRLLADDKHDDVACYRCAYWHGEEKDPESCEAFPDGIPEEILYGKFRHVKPYPNEKNAIDKGIHFAETITSTDGHNNLSKKDISVKSGNEPFLYGSYELDFTLSDFWSWSQSDTLSNSLRGILAEFLVKQRLDIKDEYRKEWNPYDLETTDGIKIEVKSSAYIQSWNQEKPSTISFNIAPTRRWDENTNKFDDEYKRHADYYIFCLLHHKVKETINPMNLNQWTFYILPTQVLNEKKPNQKTIRFNELLKLNPAECSYSAIADFITK